MTGDPYAHVPELRGKIKPLAETMFREGLLEMARRTVAKHGLDPNFITPDAEREAGRNAFLADHSGDLWVFAYGSLMWDPAIRFDELRHAHVSGYARSMCLYDDAGGRGEPDRPGLMAGLDIGASCDGLAFRVAQSLVDVETYFLWSREMIAVGYLPRMVSAETPQGPIEALAFVADHTQSNIRTDIPYDDQIRFIATGEGILGTSFDYVDSLIQRFEMLGIEDLDLRRMWEDARACRDQTI